jgi:hypothetical protein
MARGIDEAQLLARVDERIATRLTGLLDDLRRDLSERLTAEVHHQFDARLDAERNDLDRRFQEQLRGVDAQLQEQRRGLEEHLDHMARSQGSSHDQSSRVELQAVAEHLAKQMLPRLVKVEIEAERGQIMGLVEQYLRELGPRVEAGGNLNEERLASMHEAMASKAAEVARQEAQAAVKAALGQRHGTVQPLEPTRSGLTGVYLAALAAALAGIGAAAAVYVLVT